ncbi:hypothetical protein QBC34DRAFT_418138 [Podospora aff. communis PSN243]|uniref:Uncharacterized protein n=1 Tax=Podospora aff. communis PSN243 TaxID=3040156 RepID=A0AAV9G3U3_9PEZI|nr:hypothetical protein QBC34DRAFT_418138 [Podospora aff. communis PSN243]
MHPPLSKILRLSFLYTFYVIISGTVCAMVRVPFIQPYLGEQYAELVEMPVMGVFIWKAARNVVVGQLRASKGNVDVKREGLAVGLLALFWFLMMEMGVKAWVNRGRPGGCTAYFWDRDPVAGTVFFGMLAWLGVLPGLMG